MAAFFAKVEKVIEGRDRLFARRKNWAQSVVSWKRVATCFDVFRYVFFACGMLGLVFLDGALWQSWE